MYHELFINDSQISDIDIRSIIFETIDYNIQGICVPVYFIPLVKSFLPANLVLSTPIDFPLGLNDNNTREHAILIAIRKGANTVDMVLNSNHIINNRYNILKNSIENSINICQKKKITLRIIIEYRDLTPTQIRQTTCFLAENHIEYVFPSTGTKLDNYADNLIAAKYIIEKCPSLNVICNGNIWQKSQYENILAGNVFGVRFNSIHAIKTCLGV